jgi:DoxX-like family
VDTSVSHRRARVSSAQAKGIVYWATTAVLVVECVVGGVLGALRLAPFLGTATHLGYPAYFMTILGVWYVLAGVVVLAPRLPRLKEWAYAGLVFNYIGAAVSHLWVGDGAKALVGPLVFVGLTAASWGLRPQARRGFSPSPLTIPGFTMARIIGFWITTVLVAAELAVGGIWDLLRNDQVRGVVGQLGYPAYLLTIMGAWKLAGAVALLIPGFPRVKEWAYAGAVITYASAIASHLTVGTGSGALVAAVVLLALTVASWVLHPPLSNSVARK